MNNITPNVKTQIAILRSRGCHLDESDIAALDDTDSQEIYHDLLTNDGEHA